MLGELHIRDLGVIDEARLRVAPGLNVLTGETGAGKTMVVDALALLLGERADPGAVRSGRPWALIEGRLAVDEDGQAAAALAASGVEDEEGEVVVARQVLVEGRSRAQLQGRMATVAAIADVVRPLVEVHGQHEFPRLLRPAVQRELLDRFAGDKVLALRTEFAAAWRRFRQVTRELDDLATRARERAREADLLRYQLDEIGAAGVRVGELAELDAEVERLTNAETLRDAAGLAWQLLEGEEDAGASTALGAAARAVAGPGRHDPPLGELAQRAAGLAAEVGDLASSLRAYAESVLVDPERLEVAQGRISLLRDLQRKYGDDEAAVLDFAERAAARLAELEGGVLRSEALEAEAGELRTRLADLGGALSARRAEAAARLAAALQGELTDLAMPHARVEIAVEQDEHPAGLGVGGRRLAAAEDGLDRVDVRLSANPGMPLRPLARAASGGELSRVMLALRVVLAGVDRTPTLVFDEVDAGVGGRTAAAVGHRLAQLARHHQVLVVTHLPQIAAYADRHFVVEKQAAEEQTRTAVRALDGTERVAELSRMLSGMEGSGLAQAHAEELLAAASAAKRAAEGGEGS
ncbi:MAG TPA: DNA repair protein RecN [Actinomycetes bacterium]|jgi:DNA repair protein RecN (Recombination protein N)|nr:DNA repair protein RecN [Actinomycetes bacterium]